MLDLGHDIVAVVAAPLSPAAGWARQAGIAVHASPRDLPGAGLGSIDYLFSISNLTVLPAEVLALAARGAINFHDGPLPDRAGLNTPVWALLEGAARHGVTWHLMTGAVDQGAVLASETFEIAAEETALSINTRCFEAGLRCFASFAADLGGAVGAAVPQDRAPERMYGRASRPDAAATIDWHQDAEDITRLVRALDFGLYANPVGAPKALLGERLLLVQQVTPLATCSGREPGTIILSGPTPVVATGTQDLRIDRIAALDGEVLSGSAIGELLIEAQGFASLGAARKERLNGLDAAAGRFEAWWRRRLQMREPLQLPQFRPRVGADGPRLLVLDRTLPQGLARADALAALVLWLARAADRDSVEIGYSDSVGHALLDGVAGWFAPEMPLRLAVDFGAPLGTVADALQGEIASLHRRVAISADLIARSPELRGRASFGHPVSLQVVDRLANARPAAEAVIDLAVCLAEGTVRWTCDTTRLDPADAEDLARGFEALCASAIAAPGAAAGTLSVLEPLERRRILADWNAAAGPVPEGPAWHRHFIEQAARTPDRLAVTALGSALTYAELDAHSNRIARDLAARGVGPEVLVGLHLSRSVNMLACLIGVHKAGGAYVPLDPGYPRDRIAHMIADSGLGLILSETTLAADLPETEAPVLHVDTMAETFAAQPSSPIEDGIEGGNLAYMIYTSGSTGLPKGVMVEHRTLLNFYAGMDCHIEPDGTWLAVTSLSFDISTLELMWPLMHGYHVVIASEREVRGDVAAGPEDARPVGFSLFYFASSSAGSAAEQYQLLLEGARFADDNGFEAIWTPERHFHDFGGPYPNPAVAAAAIAATTSRVQIRAGSVVGTLHHPLRIAEEWALVDNISNGRVGIAFASGWQPNDFVLNPGAYADRPGTLARCMDDVRALWRGEKCRYPGPLGDDVEVLTYPRPVQPELPVWITSAGNADTFREAGRVGANVLTHLLGQSIEEVAAKIAAYREAWRAAGHPGEGRATLMLHTFLGESEDAVRAAVREPLIEYLRTSTNLLKQYAWSFPAFKKPAGGEKLELSDLSGEETDALLEHAFERYFETSGLFGTPEDNVALVRRLAALGVDEIGCLVDFGVDTQTVIAHLPAIARLREISASGQTHEERPLHDLMARHGVTHLQCTPSLLQMLAGDEPSRPCLAALQRLMVGGEAFPPQLARDMTGLVSGSVMNMYGPTETTVWSAVHTLERGDAAPPLGRPLLNQQIYILDRRAQPVRQGTPGELVIGGAGVVRGYHARPELTAERFTAHPFIPGERAYRTGDLARQHADGTLEFLGRLDHQVKIRGYRIELGEIEAALTAHADVTEAVVVARKEGSATRLVAYLAPRTGAPAVEELRAYLRGALPDFMVPGNFVLLEALPRTPNGKIDRNALPEPVSVVVSNDGGGAPPATGIEAQIQAIWCDLLKLPHVRVTENFFDIGGHSLLAIQVHRRLAAELPQPVALTDIFRFPTIAALGAHLSGGNEDAAALDGQNRGQARRMNNQRRLAARVGMRG